MQIGVITQDTKKTRFWKTLVWKCFSKHVYIYKGTFEQPSSDTYFQYSKASGLLFHQWKQAEAHVVIQNKAWTHNYTKVLLLPLLKSHRSWFLRLMNQHKKCMQRATKWVWSCGVSQTQSTPDRLLVVLDMENISVTSHFLHFIDSETPRAWRSISQSYKGLSRQSSWASSYVNMYIFPSINMINLDPIIIYTCKEKHINLHWEDFLTLWNHCHLLSGQEGMGPKCIKPQQGKFIS